MVCIFIRFIVTCDCCVAEGLRNKTIADVASCETSTFQRHATTARKDGKLPHYTHATVQVKHSQAVELLPHHSCLWPAHQHGWPQWFLYRYRNCEYSGLISGSDFEKIKSLREALGGLFAPHRRPRSLPAMNTVSHADRDILNFWVKCFAPGWNNLSDISITGHYLKPCTGTCPQRGPSAKPGSSNLRVTLPNTAGLLMAAGLLRKPPCANRVQL